MIPGIIGKKVGMTQIFKGSGSAEAVTVIEAGPCFVTQVKTVAKEGYDAVQLGFGAAKRLNRSESEHLGKAGLLKHLREFEASGIDSIEVGQKVDVSIFEPGELVDITGTSKGRGFSGVVKRHHFKGGPKTHGQSDRQRAPGAIGATTSPGRVWKGMRMAGQMGNSTVTVRRLTVLQADPQRNLLVVHGAVPGAKRGLLMIRKSSGLG